ncbi:hypothetical protein [Halobaculum gomorrense]|uniref:PH domain-containing protein n=1 Tax=Halobaculum gomorrense TaxID=43928 RepID=A0A1M5UM40_9EURY|nr:hypothetical protein [Halobaculum gomorrense]SHH64011.1 hypothetical protein SAMN05443636_3066 [Halobaculum gomorrense]
MSALQRFARRSLPASVALYVVFAVVPAVGFSPGVPVAPAFIAGAGAGVFAVAFAGAASADDLPAALSSRSPVAPLAAALAPPAVWFAVLLLFTSPESPEAALALVGVLAVVPVVVAVVLADRLRTWSALDGATEYAQFDGGDGDGTGNGARPTGPVAATLLVVAGIVAVSAGAAVVAGSVGVIAVPLDTLVPSTTALTTLLGSVTTVFAALGDDDTEYVVTDAGLRVDRALHEWDEFEGYRIEDDEVVLPRSGRLRPAVTVDADAVDDLDAVATALGRFLPRIDARGRVEVEAGRVRGSVDGDGTALDAGRSAESTRDR